jgi:hypothetical protein
VFAELPAHIRRNFCPNSVNINLYKDGTHGVGWHSDDEVLFDGLNQPIDIVSFSLGATRKFEWKRKQEPDSVRPNFLRLADGDIMVMSGMCQRDIVHRAAKDRYSTEPRINFTWRRIVNHRHQCPLAHHPQQHQNVPRPLNASVPVFASSGPAQRRPTPPVLRKPINQSIVRSKWRAKSQPQLGKNL